MAFRVLLLFLSLFILANIVILIISLIFNVNLYKKHGQQLIKGFVLFILFVVAVYVVFAIMGLI